MLDRSTYEAWLLDRLEGNLTPVQERELDAFLAANPDLAAGLEDVPNVADGRPITFAAKEGLKKAYPPTGSPDAARLDDFLVARMEQDLSAEQQQALDRFLFEHPEHAQDAKRMAAARVPADRIVFTAKETVHRHFPPRGLPDRHRLTDLLIAAEEGDLDAAQLKALAAYLSTHPEAEREQRLVRAARVERAPVVFAGKEALKKREARVIALWPRLAAAASIALLVGLGWWILRGPSGTEAGIAEHERPKPEAKTPAQEAEQPKKQGSDTVAPGSSAPAEVHHKDAPTAGQERTMHRSPAPKREQQEHNTPGAQDRVSEPAPQQQPRPEPLPIDPEPAHGPQLAQAPQAPANVPSQAGTPASAVAHGTGSDATLAAYVANAVRSDVLDKPERRTGLDGEDAVAAVDKGLSALTGGEGGLHVQRGKARERVQLKLGRNLAISASVGR